jgi:hypothetical protein
MFDRKNVNLGCDMFRPINDRPLTEAFHFAGTSVGIQLSGVARQERVIPQLIEDTNQLFTLSGGKRSKDRQDGVIHGIAVTHSYFPSDESLSCRVSNSSREWPPDCDKRSRRRLSSARQSGSSCVARQRTYSASSSNSSGFNSSTTCLISARLMLEKHTIQLPPNKPAVRQLKVVKPATCGDTVRRSQRDGSGRLVQGPCYD